jgi:urease accessory protein
VDLPAHVRAEGRIRCAFAVADGATRRLSVEEAGASRLRFPRAIGETLQAVIVNVAGGIAGGDRFSATADIGVGARVTVSSSSAERVYRSLGAVSSVDIALSVAAGGRLLWVPHETIVYDGAQYRRAVEADCDPAGRLVIAELTVLGRAASGETLTTSAIADRWRVRRGGRLVFAENLRLDAAAWARANHPAILDGATVFGLVLVVDPTIGERAEAIAALDCLRGDPGFAAGFSAWNGVGALRFLARDAASAKLRLAQFLHAVQDNELPRHWT